MKHKYKLKALKDTTHFKEGDTVYADVLEKQYTGGWYYTCLVEGKMVLYAKSSFKVLK